MTCVHFDQAQIRPQAAAASFHHLRHFHHFATSYFSVLLCFGHEGGGMLVRGCQSGERVITTARQRWTPEGRTARGRPKTIWRRALEKGWDKAGWTGGVVCSQGSGAGQGELVMQRNAIWPLVR